MRHAGAAIARAPGKGRAWIMPISALSRAEDVAYRAGAVVGDRASSTSSEGSMRVLCDRQRRLRRDPAVAALPVPGASILCRPRRRRAGRQGANQAVVLARAGVADDARRGRRRRCARRGDPRRRWRRSRWAAGWSRCPDASTDWSIVLTTPDGENCHRHHDGMRRRADARTTRWPRAGGGGGRATSLVLQGNLTRGGDAGVRWPAGARGMVTA